MPTKYHNRKVSFLGKTFDSKIEAERYLFLKQAEKQGVIKDLKTQVPYVLIPKQEVNGKKFRECSYIADFVYQKNGKMVIEDVKGYCEGTAYAVFKIKQKLMAYKYKTEVREITKASEGIG